MYNLKPFAFKNINDFLTEEHSKDVEFLAMLSKTTADDEPRFVIKTSINPDSTDFLFLEARIGKLAGSMALYDYNTEVAESEVEGKAERLTEELNNPNTIYVYRRKGVING